MRVVGYALLLVGPKAVGKSRVADIAERDLGDRYVDANELIIDLLETGFEPRS